MNSVSEIISGLSNRDKLVVAGLFLSKFDKAALNRLGFSGFHEAYNGIAYGLGGRPLSLKNYRDEFDPLFPNERKGRWNRPIRDYCKKIYERFGNLAIDDFSNLVRSVMLGLPSPDVAEVIDDCAEEENEGESSFAKRLVTGIAAEGYFEQIFPTLSDFRGGRLTNTTRFGCGFDFKVEHPENNPFMAVEVKGMRTQSGTIALTEKEHQVAKRFRERYFLFVARNFAEKPFFSLYRDPLASPLKLIRVERTIISVSWSASILN